MSARRAWDRGRRRALLMPALLLLVLIALALRGGRSSTPAEAPGPATRPPPPGEELGVNVNRLFNDGDLTLAQITTQLAAVRATGATLARSDALWEATELSAPAGGAHRYDWRFDDEIAGSLAAQGLQWLPIVDYSAPWAESIHGQEHSPPNSPQAYAAFAGALAGRYGPGGSFWRAHPGLTPRPVDTFEIWNEPDSATFWASGPNAGSYAELYLAARDAITAADPTARVIVGGLSHPDPFLVQMLAARPGLRGHIDGVGIHPYGADPGAVLANVRQVRTTLVSLGLGSVPLYVTEFGWTTSPPGATNFLAPALRPGYIAATVTALAHADCGIAALLLYTWTTPERDPLNPQDWFGIAPPRGGSSPDVTAFAEGVRDASAPARAARGC